MRTVRNVLTVVKLLEHQRTLRCRFVVDDKRIRRRDLQIPSDGLAPSAHENALRYRVVRKKSAADAMLGYHVAGFVPATHRLAEAGVSLNVDIIGFGTGPAERSALQCITEHLMPGRWADCRQPTAKERAATMVLSLPLDECSVKIRTGDPEDDPDDLVDPVASGLWAGTVPLLESFGAPVPSAQARSETPVPAYIQGWRRP